MKIVRGADISFIPASHEDPKDPGTYKKVLFNRDDFGEGHVQMINWAKMPAGKAFQLHYHETLAEIFVIIKGQAALKVDEEEIILAPGDAVRIDADEKHEMKTVGSEDVEYVVMGISTGEQGKTVVIS